jgi:hypothetical protein
MMLHVFTALAVGRDLRTLHVTDGRDGDCFLTACAYETATNLLLKGDTLIFKDKRIPISSFPSPLSDLLHTVMFMNVSMIAQNDRVILDGRLMAGESLFNVQSAARFC